MSQYEGALSRKIHSWRNEIINLLSLLEALIDFSDEELPEKLQKNFISKASNILEEMKKIISNSNYGERIRNGFVITLIGRPNVGKSTLINYLSKKNSNSY